MRVGGVGAKLLKIRGNLAVTVPVLIGGRATDAGVQARVAEAAR
jgi:hypothetical protein